MPISTELGWIVAAIVAFADPSNDAEPVTSPLRAIVLADARVVAVSALPVTSPVRSAVIMPAAKLPDPSLKTPVDAVFAAVAFEVTVKVPPSAESDPERPLPETAPSPT